MRTKCKKVALSFLMLAITVLSSAQVVVNGPIQISSGSPGVGKVLTSDASGNATWQTPSGGGGGGGADWSLTGNAGTNPNSNFLGTTDNVVLAFRVNNTNAGLIDHVAFNTSFGFRANGFISGFNTTAVGYQALMINNANNNTALGYEALVMSNVGDDNSALGYRALANSMTGGRTTGLGSGADVWSSSGGWNSTALGYNAIVNNSNKIRLGNVGVGVIEGQPSSYTGVSDARFKYNITEEVKGLDFIMKLRPVVYNFDTKKLQEFLIQNMPDSVRGHYLNQDFSTSSSVRHTGFIAQEVEQAAMDLNFDFDAIHKPEHAADNYGLAYGTFVVPLVKAIQEQQAIIKSLEDRIIQLEGGNQKKLNGTSGDINFTEFNLSQNEPNPFTHETVIKYNLPQQYNSAYMAVYDLTGKQITKLALTDRGNSSITLTSDKLSAGIYIYSIIADGKIMDSKRMVVADK